MNIVIVQKDLQLFALINSTLTFESDSFVFSLVYVNIQEKQAGLEKSLSRFKLHFREDVKNIQRGGGVNHFYLFWGECI